MKLLFRNRLQTHSMIKGTVLAMEQITNSEQTNLQQHLMKIVVDSAVLTMASEIVSPQKPTIRSLQIPHKIHSVIKKV